METNIYTLITFVCLAIMTGLFVSTIYLVRTLRAKLTELRTEYESVTQSNSEAIDNLNHALGYATSEATLARQQHQEISAECARLQQKAGNLELYLGDVEATKQRLSNELESMTAAYKGANETLHSVSYQYRTLKQQYEELAGDPALLEQYKQWLVMRAQQDAVLALLRGGSDDRDNILEESPATAERTASFFTQTVSGSPLTMGTSGTNTTAQSDATEDKYSAGPDITVPEAN